MWRFIIVTRTHSTKTDVTCQVVLVTSLGYTALCVFGDECFYICEIWGSDSSVDDWHRWDDTLSPLNSNRLLKRQCCLHCQGVSSALKMEAASSSQTSITSWIGATSCARQLESLFLHIHNCKERAFLQNKISAWKAINDRMRPSSKM